MPFDYASLVATLNNSKLAKTNNAAYQTIYNLIGGVRDSTDVLNQQFTNTNGQVTSLAEGVNNSFAALNATISTLQDDIISLANYVNSLNTIFLVAVGGGANVTPDGTFQIIKDTAGNAGSSHITILATVDGVVNPQITVNFGVFRVFGYSGGFYQW